MKLYLISKILGQNELKEVNKFIDNANTNNNWQNGKLTSSYNKEIKNNLEISNINLNNNLNNYIRNFLLENNEFANFTIPNINYASVISKTECGGYYNPHIDNWINGDYSTTVFLNNPDEYEGGELCLYFGGENEFKVKLDAGWSITYPTGILHRVNKVKSGTRYASIIWTTSLIKDPFIRYVYNELGNIKNNISPNNSLYVSNCYSATKDPYFCIDNLRNQLIRNYIK